MVTAQRLFAEQGIDGVSLRQITRDAGEKNVTALQYHFGDRPRLLLAVLERGAAPLSEDMHRRLDAIDGDDPGVRPVVAAFVEPLFDCLASDEGRFHVRIAAQVIGRATRAPSGPADPLAILVDDPAGAISRWAERLDPYMPDGVNGGPLHQRFSMLRFGYVEAARRSLEPASVQARRLLSSHLVDLMAAMAVVAPSEETVAALAQLRRRPK